MKAFLITATFSDPYPKTKEYREEATKFDYACKKALSKFRKEFKGKRIDDFSLRCQDLGTIPKAEKFKVSKELGNSMDNALNFLNHAMRQVQ